MSDIRNRPYRVPPQLVPEELDNKKSVCPACQSELPIPWLETLAFPKQPVKSDVADGHWVPASIPLRCNAESCGHQFEVAIPRSPCYSRWVLYGDEASRYIPQPNRSLHFFCISLAACHRKESDRLRRRLEKLKKKLAPNRDPSSWQHHFSEIWGSSPSSREFALTNKQAKLDHAQNFARIIREARPELATFNVSACIDVPDSAKQRKEKIKAQKQDLFCQSLLTTLQQLRARHHSIRWVFDNIKDTTSGSRTEGWASECFLGLQYTRLFAWLSSGATVLEPEFVSPGSHFLLEVADFVSYCVARDFEKRVQGSSSEFPSSLLGEGFYQVVLPDRSAVYEWSRGLPFKHFL